MAKIKVHELAKELDKQSKEVLSFLKEQGIEAKAAQSSIEEGDAEKVRKHFGGAKAEKTVEAAAAKKEEKTTEKPETAPANKEEKKAETKEEPKKKKKLSL